MRPLLKVTRETNFSIVVIHHDNKSGDSAGSVDWELSSLGRKQVATKRLDNKTAALRAMNDAVRKFPDSPSAEQAVSMSLMSNATPSGGVSITHGLKAASLGIAITFESPSHIESTYPPFLSTSNLASTYRLQKLTASLELTDTRQR